MAQAVHKGYSYFLNAMRVNRSKQAMVKQVFKRVISFILFYSQLLRLYFVFKRISLVKYPRILMYHRVLDIDNAAGYDFSNKGMVVSREKFARQISFLSKNYSVISLDQFLEASAFPPNACIITFDDGWLDNYTVAYPILKAHNCPATIFLTTDFVGTNRVFWQETLVRNLTLLMKRGLLREFSASKGCPSDVREKLLMITSRAADLDCANANFDELIAMLMDMNEAHVDAFVNHVHEFLHQIGVNPDDKRRILDWQEIEEMHRNGIAFGSHSKTHRIMTRMDIDDIKAELSESKGIIESRLGTKVKAFAYPNGDWSKDLETLVIAAGYKCALSTEKGEFSKGDNAITLKRIGIHEAMSTGLSGKFSKHLFACQVGGIFDDIRWLLSKIVRRVGTKVTAY